MEWQEYVKHILSQKSVLDEIELRYNDKTTLISRVIKASITMRKDGSHQVIYLLEIHLLEKTYRDSSTKNEYWTEQ